MPIVRRHLLLSLGAGLLPGLAQAALPQPGATLLGSGQQRFFGLLIYDARLWANPGFDPNAYTRGSFALELEYARALEGSAIAERSLDEMRRLETLGAEREQAWRAFMKTAFPNVVAGDKLVGGHDADGSTRFEHNGRTTASTQDADFGRLFFGIWLSPQTSEPGLRRALLGL